MVKYKTIVIDPPWDIALTGNTEWPIDDKLPYETMDDEKIKQFPIHDFAGDDCDLFLWTTKSKLPVAFEILNAWGFKYKNIIAWNKGHGVCTNGFYNTLEFVVYGLKGTTGISFTNPLSTYVQEGNSDPKKMKHSRKPLKFYASLLKTTSEPRIDIFARKRHFGFDAWGNQVEKQIEYPLLTSSETKGEP